jgi:uncharacterized protein (TIGR04255 family)
MSTVFPQSERVIYKRNPLDQVVCQLRFPPILKIESQTPSDFQEMIRSKFPNYSASTEQTIPANVPQEIQKLLFNNPNSSTVNHEFSTSDKKWSLLLAKDSLSLTANAYQKWEDFKEILHQPLEALKAIYIPSCFQRIGLRYINTIDYPAIGNDAPLTELFQSHVLGPLNTSLAEKFEGMYSSSVIKLSGDSSVRLSTGLGEKHDAESLSKQKVFIIDADFHTITTTEIDHATDVIDNFNCESGRLFRWCISDNLHKLMEPVKPSEYSH